MTDSTSLDPEVLELLDEIAADPDSTLLRVPREPLRRFLALREGPVSAREPVLTRAEKHLVQLHREYVARLLYDGCRLALTREPVERTRIHSWVSSGEPLLVPSASAWRSRATREIESTPRHDDLYSTRSLLERGLGPGESPAPSEFAGASLRLLPCDETRIWLAVALHREGQSRSARHALHFVLGNGSSARNEMWARVDLGYVAFAESNFFQAVDWYRSAASVEEGASIPALNWLSSSLQVGSESEVLAAQDRLGSMVLEIPVVEDFLRILRNISPTPACRQLLSKSKALLSPITRSVADALLC